MFTYIQNHEYLNEHPEILSEYKNSMIFLGDQQQIYVPVINTYVGLGVDAYSYILEKFNGNESNLSDLISYINNNNVTSIYAQYSPKDFGTGSFDIPYNGDADSPNLTQLTINSNDPNFSKNIQKLKANRNVVIRGVHDDTNVFNTLNTNSGINVTIKHEGSLQSGSVNDKYSYSYYNPEHDIILIDDSKTWSYIASVNSYIIDFASKFATQQANRIYKNIIGEDTVYIEKEFNEAFINDIIIDNESNQSNQIRKIQNVYVKGADNDGEEQWYEVYVGNELDENQNYDNNGIYIAVKDPDNNNVIRYEKIAEYNNTYNIYTYVNSTIPFNNDPKSGSLETIVLGTENLKTPVWYQFDDALTSTYNMNVSDGIQTIKEVAYILDLITNGSNEPGSDDPAISLTYNIAQNYKDIQDLKNRQDAVEKGSVISLTGKSDNAYLTVNTFSESWNADKPAQGNVTAQINLVLGQLYTGPDNNSYAAYLPSHANEAGVIKNYYYTLNDDDNYDNYYSVSDLSKTDSKIYQMLSEYYGDDFLTANLGTDRPKPAQQITDSNDVISYTTFENSNNTISQIIANSAEFPYIYWNKHRLFEFDDVTTENLPTKGLTTVQWVTTYVGWAADDIINRLNIVNNATQEAIDNSIKNLYAYAGDNIEAHNSYSDQSSLGLFVSNVTEHNGIIEVAKTKLPLDEIISSTSFSPGLTTDNDNSGKIYCNVTKEFACENYSDNNIYAISKIHGTKQPISSSNINDIRTSNDFIFVMDCGTISEFTPVNSTATINDIITNGGKVSYFYKDIRYVNNSNIYQYIPLDPQIAYTNTSLGLFNDNGGVIENKIYYSASFVNHNYYLKTDTYHNNDGSTTTVINAYISYLSTSSESSTGFADAWDVRRTIESMFTWIDLTTNKVIS